MDIVNQKYNNFLKLILEVDNTNEWITWAQTIDLTTFLINIKLKNHLSVNDIYNEMLVTTELKPEIVEPFSEKLKKYFDYFKQISNII